MAWLDPPSGGQQTATIIKTEEKGSDVNLVVHWLNDACKDYYDCAALMSNDSDFEAVLRLSKQEHNKTIGLITPTRFRVSSQLRQYTTYAKKIRKRTLANSQLSDLIPNTNIRKPSAWEEKKSPLSPHPCDKQQQVSRLRLPGTGFPNRLI